MKLVRIKELYLYVGLTFSAQKCYELKKYLTDNKIPFTQLNYMDEAAHPSVYESLNTWNWGPNGEKRTFNDFPILTWMNCFDDFTLQAESATSIFEVQSKLLPNAEFINNAADPPQEA